jgi:hypothetical protein
VVRKLLVKMEEQADLSQSAPGPAKEPRVAVKVRQRASRRAVKRAGDEAEAEARALTVAAQLVSWYNQYEERPEIEQDYQQMKSGGWQLTKLSSTRYSEIVFYILTVV